MRLLHSPYHRINTQPEVRLRVGAFDVGVLTFFGGRHFASKRAWKMFTFY